MCVSDILDNKVDYFYVVRIDSGTRISTLGELYDVMMSYDEAAWREHSFHKAINVVQRLLFDGRLLQPRLYGYKPDLSNGIWTEATDEDIVWNNHTHPIITDEYDLKLETDHV